MKTIIYDLETDGLLSEVSKMHCLVTIDADSGEERVFHDSPQFLPCAGTLAEGVAYLGQADRTAGHNILGYDAPVLAKLGYVDRTHVSQDRTKMLDTVVLSRLVYSDRKERDFALHAQEKLQGKYIGAHSLGSWGDRLGFPKADYNGGWAEFSQEMLDYCIQDVRVNHRLYQVLMKRLPHYSAGGLDTVTVEHLFAGQLEDQQTRGVKLDRKVGEKLLAHLHVRRTEMEEKIAEAFPPIKKFYKLTSKGVPRKVRCRETGELRDHKLLHFNPGSRQQLAARLIKAHGWVPKELTANGNPSMVEDVLRDLADIYPEVGHVLEWSICNSRIAILEDGPSGYFRLCDENDVLHGRTLHIGTVTHRCAHSKPNTGNVTSVRKPYGKELRQVFRAFPGYIQAGFDADGLELRMLGHYLAEFDGGTYGKAVVSGDKSKGTDPHSIHAKAISEAVPCDRDTGKTCTYAFLYGAGDARLGKTFGKGTGLGKKIRASLRKNIDGLAPLLASIEDQVRQTGSIISLDGRRTGIRHEHAALNSLLQTAGAVVMRWVPVYLERLLPDYGIIPGKDFLQTGHIHDEVQGSLRPHMEDNFSRAVEMAFTLTTESLGLRVPVSGTAEFGTSWADTH